MLRNERCAICKKCLDCNVEYLNVRRAPKGCHLLEPLGQGGVLSSSTLQLGIQQPAVALSIHLQCAPGPSRSHSHLLMDFWQM